MSEKSEDMIFTDGENNLIVKSNIIRLFKKYEQKNSDYESGGILLGYIYSNYVEIIKIITPSKLDSFGRFFFIRSKERAQRKIDKYWYKSKGILNYVGEWHTHSTINPIPSETDKESIKKTFEMTILDINFLYTIIVGQKNTYWIGKQTKQRLIELNKIIEKKKIIFK